MIPPSGLICVLYQEQQTEKLQRFGLWIRSSQEVQLTTMVNQLKLKNFMVVPLLTDQVAFNSLFGQTGLQILLNIHLVSQTICTNHQLTLKSEQFHPIFYFI